jgi:DNA-binding GntR family transcriptional regulator
VRISREQPSDRPRAGRNRTTSQPDYSTATEYITLELRGDILTGRLAAGEPLRLDELAERFGTSSVPVREALRVLHADRFVVLRPYHVARVAELRLEDIEALLRLLLILVPEGIRWAHGQLTVDDFEALHAMVNRLEEIAFDADHRRGDYYTAYSIYMELHLRIHSATGSSLLVSMVERVLAETWRYRFVISRSSPDFKAWVQNQRRLVELLEGGTAADAADEMRKQIEDDHTYMLNRHGDKSQSKRPKQRDDSTEAGVLHSGQQRQSRSPLPSASRE